MDLLATLGQTLYPGQRIPRVKGWNGAVNYHIPRDCEATLLDQDSQTGKSGLAQQILQKLGLG